MHIQHCTIDPYMYSNPKVVGSSPAVVGLSPAMILSKAFTAIASLHPGAKKVAVLGYITI